MADATSLYCGSPSLEIALRGIHQVTKQERSFEKDVKTGGYVTVEGEKMDFLMATYGSPLKEGSYKAVVLPDDGCEPIIGSVFYNTTLPQHQQVTSAIVDRGGCDFYNKTFNLAQAGAGQIIIVNDDDHPIRPGVLRWLGYNITATVINVGKKAGEIMKEKAGNDEKQGGSGSVDYSVELSSQVRGSLYMKLSNLANHPRGELTGWPLKSRERKGLYRKIKKEMQLGDGSSAELWSLFHKACKVAGLNPNGEEL